MNAKLLSLVLLATLATGGAARAQGLQISFGEHGGHRAFGVGLWLPAPRPEPRRVWVPGHYETAEQRVWVAGGERREWIPPRYETRYDECGRPYSVLVRQGAWKVERANGHFEVRPVTVWVEGYWRTDAVACASDPGLGAWYRGYDRDRYGCTGRSASRCD
jgi:hypothetical protein